MGGLLARVDALQRRTPALAFVVAVLKKYGEDGAGSLAAVIAYYAIFSIFPLLLALTAVLGFVLHGHPDWQHAVTNSALRDLPLVGANRPQPLHGSVLRLVVGAVLALWSGLGVAKSAQRAFDSVYLVARSERPDFLRSTARAVALVAVGGSGLIATTAVSSAVTSVHSIDGFSLGAGLKVAGIALAVVLNVLLFLVLFNWLTVSQLTWRHALPGAVMTAVALQVMQLAASAFISHKLKGASATYGNFAAVIVLLSWFALQAQVVLLAAEVNVVRQRRLWPRALVDAPANHAPVRRRAPGRPAVPSDPG
jgi:membrane protein